MTRLARILIAAMVGLTMVPAAPALVAPAAAADPVPPYIAPDASWLATVNYYRAMVGVAPVRENASWSAGAYNHSCYMLYNGMTHTEIPGRPGYTASGANAGVKGNIAVSTRFGATARNHVDLWMTGPFHAIRVLRHNLATVAFGKCDNSATSPWKSAATLNVLDGLTWKPRPSTPILFPGNGTTTSLNRFFAESPDPLPFCGWTGTAGLPVIAMMPEAVTRATATMTGPNGPLETCRLYQGNTSGGARSILAGDNAVTVIPRQALAPGLHSVNITTQARSVTWSFTVDPAAATGIMPIPTVSPAGSPSHFTAIEPFRFADSRAGLRATRLRANVPARIRVAGVAGVPAGTTAISANITVANQSAAGWLTVYNCTAPTPTASTLNYSRDDAVANAGIFPLGASDVCVVASTETELIVDVNGFFHPLSTDGYTAIRPLPVVDTQLGIGSSQRPGPDTITAVDVGSVADDATAVALNITGIDPSARGYVTAFPCGDATPTVSNVNPMVGATRQNFAIVPVGVDGTVCFSSSVDLDLRVDLLGYFAEGGSGTIVPTTPTRIVDTRDGDRPAMNFDFAGSPVAAGTREKVVLAGQRGIPIAARAVSLNLTVVRPSADGTITIWGCGGEPSIVSITFVNDRTVANGVQVDLSDTGALCVRTTAETHLVLDVTGYWN